MRTITPCRFILYFKYVLSVIISRRRFYARGGATTTETESISYSGFSGCLKLSKPDLRAFGSSIVHEISSCNRLLKVF